MKREIVVIVRESGGVYQARYGKHSASASCSAAVAAARCGAKALGLCPSRKPADMRMRDYYRIVGQEASTVRIKQMLDCPNAYEAMHDDGDRGLAEDLNAQGARDETTGEESRS